MEQIKHRGRIVAMNNKTVQVQITSHSACAGCSAKTVCHMTECRNKIIEVAKPQNHSFHPGDEVTLTVSPQTGFWAVFYGYGLPLILVLAVLILAISQGFSELIAGICSIILLIPYYFGLFLSKKYMAEKFRFHIED